MLSNRQKQILNLLLQVSAQKNLITSSYIARELNVTTKTIRNDIKSLNKELLTCEASIETITGKGYRLHVANENKLTQYLNGIAEEAELSSSLSGKSERVNYVIGFLIFSSKPVLSDHIAYKIFVSRSQLSLDLKDMKEILQRYNLTLKFKSHNGIYIDGTEQNKRLCLIKEKINYQRHLHSVWSRSELSEILFNALTEARYEISDLDLQNLILYVEMALLRIQSNNLLTSLDIDPDSDLGVEMEIASNIYKTVSKKFRFEITQAEYRYLASMIHGFRVFNSQELISDETEQFILSLLVTINEHFGIDFTNDIELRINLALHLIPLVSRGRNQMLSKNLLLTSIKQSMPLAYDIAIVALRFIEESFHIFLNEDEAGHLAVYFNMAQSNIWEKKQDKHVLVITSSRKSESLLLRFNIQKYFGDKIETLDIIQLSDLNRFCPAAYDAVFSTVTSPVFASLGCDVTKINYFLTSYDCRVIGAALTHDKQKKLLENFFSERLFFSRVSFSCKEEVLRFMCSQIAACYHMEEDLYQAVMNREYLGTTAFTNLIALPHPDHLIADTSAIAVAILNQPIKWGNDMAQIIFLVNVRKGGEDEMQYLYTFLSSFIQDKSLISRLQNQADFSTLIDILSSFNPDSAIL